MSEQACKVITNLNTELNKLKPQTDLTKLKEFLNNLKINIPQQGGKYLKKGGSGVIIQLCEDSDQTSQSKVKQTENIQYNIDQALPVIINTLIDNYKNNIDNGIKLALTSKALLTNLPDELKKKLRLFRYLDSIFKRTNAKIDSAYSIDKNRSIKTNNANTTFNNFIKSLINNNSVIFDIGFADDDYSVYVLSIDTNGSIKLTCHTPAMAEDEQNRSELIENKKITIITLNDNKITLDILKIQDAIKQIIDLLNKPKAGGALKHKYKGLSYKVRTGLRGGKYILVKGKKIYI